MQGLLSFVMPMAALSFLIAAPEVFLPDPGGDL
ncbi:DUF417 family protein [Flavobacterium endoglycinae]|uniref:DUF417 family protein n=1 Tax=Flavobacterium endoglycinae TaxID=2816357 RepID=A0ABX7QMC1_9FLAO|nr:DUF417 family protein [Flavobacterium endoglycinae]